MDTETEDLFWVEKLLDRSTKVLDEINSNLNENMKLTANLKPMSTPKSWDDVFPEENETSNVENTPIPLQEQLNQVVDRVKKLESDIYLDRSVVVLDAEVSKLKSDVIKIKDVLRDISDMITTFNTKTYNVVSKTSNL